MTPEEFGVTSDSDIPLCLAYNGDHFESMIPINPSDVEKTKDLVRKVSDGTYNYNKKDIPWLIAPFSDSDRKKRYRQTKPEANSAEKYKIAKQQKEARQADPKAYSAVKDKINEARQADPEAYSAEKYKYAKQQKEARQADPEAYSAEKYKIAKQQKEARQADPKAYSAEKDKIVKQKIKNKTIAFQSNLERDTGFDSICCICRTLKSKDKVTNIINIPLALVTEYCHKNNITLSSDGKYNACKECRDMMKKKKETNSSSIEFFEDSSFPKSLIDELEVELGSGDETSLNKLEAFILKLIIPFVRVAHCKRGQYLEVRGNLILISSDVAQSLQTIIPREQRILPVAFKRKLSYDGHYIAEYVDRKKIEIYFNWLKKNNHLFKNIEFSTDTLDKIEEDLCEEPIDSLPIPVDLEINEDENIPDIEDEIDLFSSELSEIQGRESEGSDKTEKVEAWQQHSTLMKNKYDEDMDTNTWANQYAGLIVHMEEGHHISKPTNVPDNIMNEDNEDFFCEDIFDDKSYVEDEVVTNEDSEKEDPTSTCLESVVQSDDKKGKTASKSDGSKINADIEADMKAENRSKKVLKNLVNKLDKISVAPGEHGRFQNWKQDVYIEEKAFPHIFPYGTGGYLSTCLSSGTNIGFAAYVRQKMRCADPKFRSDQVYVFFLLLVKEHIELKNCKSTYLRQARNTPGLTKSALDVSRYHSLERYGRNFNVFKHMRGTAPYFEAVKKNVMATIRQRGAPTHFVTLSAAEYQWSGLLKSVYETVYKKPATDEVIESMSTNDKSKLITENVVQTTLHFQKRVDKLMTKMIEENYLEENTEAEEAVPFNDEDLEEEEASCASYFYRIEFQARLSKCHKVYHSIIKTKSLP